MGSAHRTLRRDVRRLGTTGFVLALSAALVFPGTASAAPGPDPLIVNDCDSTLKGESGTPVTLDVGSILQAPGVLTVGLGNDSEGTNGNEKPLLVVPVKEGVDTLGLSGAPVVRDVTGETCGVLKEAGNATGAAVQGVLPGDDLPGTAPEEPEPTEPAPTPPAPPAPEPGAPEDPAPGEGDLPPGLTDPGSIGAGLGGVGGGNPFVPAGRFQALGPITIPPLAGLPPLQAPQQAPDLNAPNAAPLEKQPDVLTENSGTAEAMPASTPPERLPLLLAVLAVVIVAALLARTWVRTRKTA